MMLRPLPWLFAMACLVAPAQAPVQEFKLANGLSCLLLENHERSMVRMELTARWDPALDPSVRNGMVGFLARLLESSGAGPYGRPEYNRAADDLGLVLSFEGRTDGFHWGVLTDSRSQEAAFEFLANGVFRPVIDSPAVEAERQILLKKAAGTPLREGAIARFLWNLQDPRVTLAPAGAGLDHLELQDLWTLQRRLIRPENAVLVLYGDLSLTQAKELAFLHLGVWGPSPVPAPAWAAARMPFGPKFTALLEGARAELWVGAPRSGPGGAKEELLAILLERAFRNPVGDLDLGLELDPAGPMIIRAAARDASKDPLLPGLLLDHLRLLGSQGFTAEELSRAKIQWRARNAALALHPEALLQSILRRPSAPAAEALTVAEVNQALSAWLQPEGLRYLLLGGDAATLKAAEKSGLGPAILVKP